MCIVCQLEKAGDREKDFSQEKLLPDTIKAKERFSGIGALRDCSDSHNNSSLARFKNYGD